MANPYKNKITVERITSAGKNGNVRAYASIKLGSTLTIHGVKVIQQDGQRAYVRLPDQKSPDGSRYFQVVESNDQLFMDAVQEKVLQAWIES